MLRKIKKIFKVPFFGWVLGGFTVLLLLFWYQLKRARLLAARLKVESELRTVRRSHEALIKQALEGNVKHKSETGQQLLKMERQRLQIVKAIKHKAKNLEGLSDAFNDVFK